MERLDDLQFSGLKIFQDTEKFFKIQKVLDLE